MPPKKETVVVAMSGGVDSSVAAALLQDAGHDVIGVFMRNGIKANADRDHRQGCCGVEDALDARRVADRLEIPFYALDLSGEFEALTDDFVSAYVAGRTPNPCVQCNRQLKMGAVLELAVRLGADAVATGHYARIGARGERLAVHRARDGAKDQSYFLFPLPQDALARTRFPLGEMTKAAVRAEARRRSLGVDTKAESMEICFVPTGDYRDLLAERAPEALVPGPIIDESGRVLGQHQGTARFTIGQRRGLPSGQRRPLYVTAIDPANATVTVGEQEDLRRTRFVVSDIVWSGSPPLDLGARLHGGVRIRSQHREAEAKATGLDGDRVLVELAKPELAITPGQAAVFYEADCVLFGGSIVEVLGMETPDPWPV